MQICICRVRVEYVNLSDICKINMGQSPESTSYNSDKQGVPFYQGNADFGALYPNPRIWCSKPIKLAKENDILISVRAPVGALNFSKEECCIGRGLAAITLVSNDFLIEFIYWSLRTGVKELQSKSTGSTFKSINKKVLEEVRIPKISLKDQEGIIRNITLLTNILTKYEQETVFLDELVKARFVEMFGDVQDAKKHSDKQLKDICNTVTGGTPFTKHAEYYNGTIPWISTVSLGPNYIDGTTAKAFITQEAVDNSSTKIIPSGSILFGTRVGVGKSSINQVEMCTNQDIVAIIDLDESKYNKLYIKYVLDTYQSYFDSIKKGATILGISSDDLKNIYIPAASLYEQNRFEKFVKQIDKSRSRIQKSLEASQELFDSLMQEYFG